MSFKDIELKTEYRSLQNDIIAEFYIPILKQSKLYQRAVGFFSSSALLELSKGICGLIENDGSIQLIASPRLSNEDINAINEGIKRRDEVVEEALLRELRVHQGKYEEARLNLLSNLIAAKRLEIKIALLETNKKVGMYHEKVGLMFDKTGNIIAFSGSMNESANAFLINYESIDVFTSWSKDEDRVHSKKESFEALWSNHKKGLGIEVKEFSKVDKAIIEKYKKTDTVDTCIDELYLKEEQTNYSVSVKKSEIGPKIPDYVTMREYQETAISNWINNNYVGIFDMATGTGKTYTALAAIAQLYKNNNNNLAVLIICPYQHLVEQWKDDIIQFGMKPIICYSASAQKNWLDRLKTAVTSFNLGVQNHFCMVSTNATFSLDYVQTVIKKLKGNVVLVVDEAHNFGAEHLSRTLLPHIPFRLALSATIDRHGDPDGTKKLYEYFNKKCIEYTLSDAIDNDMLTPYYYYPIYVTLDDEELDDYLDLTLKISRNIHLDKSGNVQLSEYAKILLIKRARIVAGAKDKLSKLREYMTEYIEDNQMLIYCGATTMRDIDYQEGKLDSDEVRQIDAVVNLLGNELGMRVTKFTSEEKSDERERIKADFAEGKHLQALIAIRCLDEGVNIPSIRTAFILASSTNPKEYIQRRGRVLRKFPGKKHSKIYDFITLPIKLEDVKQFDPAIIMSVKSLAKREIIRMKDFASIAENPFYSDSLISEIERIYDVDINEEEGSDIYV